MITTDQKNNGNLGETRTFSVHNHSAEGMKNEINAGNESSLSSKNRAHKTVQRAPSAAANSARVHNSTGAERPRADAERRARTEQINRQTVPPRTEANPVRRETRSTAQNISQSRNTQNNAENRQLQPVVRNTPKPAKPVSAEKTAPVTLSKSMNTTMNTGTAKKEPEKNRVKSDEGGNTVLSIVKAIVYIIFVIIISVFLALGIILVGNDVFAFVKSDEVVEITIPEYATPRSRVSADSPTENDTIKYSRLYSSYTPFTRRTDGRIPPRHLIR